MKTINPKATAIRLMNPRVAIDTEKRIGGVSGIIVIATAPHPPAVRTQPDGPENRSDWWRLDRSRLRS
jgi:hypothetical protein